MAREVISTTPPQITWDDVAGQARIKNFFHWILSRNEEEKIELGKDQAFLLLGPAGSGKDMLLQATAGEFVRRGFQYFCLTVPENGQIPQGFDKRLAMALEDGDCVLVIRRPERLNDPEEFGEFLESVSETPRRLVILAKSDKVEKIDGDITSFFCQIYGQKPTFEDRLDFFEAGLPEMLADLKKELAEQTEGYGYGQLTSLLLLLILRINYCFAQGFLNEDSGIERLEQYVKGLLQEYCLPRETVPGVQVAAPAKAPLKAQPPEKKQPDMAVLREKGEDGHYLFHLKPL